MTHHKPVFIFADDERILHDIISLVISSTFEKHNTSVVSVYDGKSLVEHANKIYYEKNRNLNIITDVNMPKSSGIEALSELKRNDIGLKALIITGDYRNETELRDKGYQYLLKPFTPTQLEIKLREIWPEYS